MILILSIAKRLLHSICTGVKNLDHEKRLAYVNLIFGILENKKELKYALRKTRTMAAAQIAQRVGSL